MEGFLIIFTIEIIFLKWLFFLGFRLFTMRKYTQKLSKTQVLIPSTDTNGLFNHMF